MSLSDQERQMLREIEQSLLADDPRFGARVGHDDSYSNPVSGLTLRGVALTVLGLVLLLGGVALAQTSLWWVALSVCGFALMLGSGIWMLRGGRSASEINFGHKPQKKPSPSRGSSLGDRLEDNFRRRFDNP
ncbi:DUF3040 domain-containing protein [Corynebacterium poyangense]|uniref:DUF3040 domain-containing protein n=1 Tax=Corynebacterium poyangense TaxID=2684405 RepID=A0A7H0SPU3_9CORY|nr:DUF3040 domain-containing protein [Corynebacterium poyangense]MBZ8178157.1 DUF3040 domain-containing protein [Corynebacterium poyangense]QNQ90568.1 DUF3040 domain-containing protein [Corynebacterium poyangense]